MTNRNLILAIFATIVLALMLWTSVSAQDVSMCEVKPDGSIMCCETQPDGSELCTSSISSTLTPFVPTATIVPTVTATSEPVIRPLRRVYLPIASK